MTVKPPGSVRPVQLRSFMMRRVFTQGSNYICGICRKSHASADEANSCLHHCWQLVLKEAPWTSHKKLGKLEFHCLYCQRAFETPEGAANCAAECASTMTITSHEGATIIGTRSKRTFGKKLPIRVSLKVPYKITKSKPETTQPMPGKIAEGDSASQIPSAENSSSDSTEADATSADKKTTKH